MCIQYEKAFFVVPFLFSELESFTLQGTDVDSYAMVGYGALNRVVLLLTQQQSKNKINENIICLALVAYVLIYNTLLVYMMLNKNKKNIILKSEFL